MKYKVLGFAIIAFILLWLYIMLRPKEGTPYHLFRNNSIDSIVVIKNYKPFLTITDTTNLKIISEKLRRLKKVDVEYGIDVKATLYFINIYFNKNKKLERIRFIPKYSKEVVVQINEVYYEAQDLDRYLTSKVFLY